MPAQASWRELGRRLALPLALLALAIVRVDALERLPSVCLFRNLFGLRCPACGLTRAFCCALHGDFGAAFAYNPLVVVALPVCAIAAIYDLFMLARFATRGIAPRPRPAGGPVD